MTMRVAVILPAAGLSRRFGGGNKLELDLAGRPAFMRSVEAFAGRDDVCQIILAVHPESLDAFRFKHGTDLGLHGVELVAGGTVERWETVSNALAHVGEEATHIAVHDAARPMVSAQLIDRVFNAALSADAVIPGTAVRDSLKRIDGELAAADTASPANALDDLLGPDPSEQAALPGVVDSVSRSRLVAVQTPQVFKRSLLVEAYKQLAGDGFDKAQITDDAGLVQALGEAVRVVEGDPLNLKVTVPADAELLQLLFDKRRAEHATRDASRQLFGDDDDA